MIFSTILLSSPERRKIATCEYWPSYPSRATVSKYLDELDDLIEQSERNRYRPLEVDGYRFLSRDCGDEAVLVFAASLGSDVSDLVSRINRGARIMRNAIKKVKSSQLKKEYANLLDPVVRCKFVVALAGATGVGKTSLFHLLVGHEAPSDIAPTIALNAETVETVLFGNYELVVLDFAGQDHYHKMWDFSAANLILLLTDSTLSNVVTSSKMLTEITSDYPSTPVVVVANKQDKSEALDPSAISKVMRQEVHTMVAIDLAYREPLLWHLTRALCKQTEVPLPEGPLEDVLRFPNSEDSR